MKKQILFMMFFSLALVFAGVKSYGQQVEVDHLNDPPTWCVPALPLNCGDADNALAPLPGVPYDYTVASTSVSTVHWFVTDEAAIIDAGGIIAAIETDDGTGDYILAANAAYDDPANTSLTVNITWKSFDGTTNNVILVAYIWDDITCTNNIEVYRIEPQYSFTLDIAGILDDGTEGDEECVSPIVNASYDGTTLLVDYGMNYVFFTVNAANWQTSWRPVFVASTDGGSTLGDPEWAYPGDATTGGAWNASGTTEVLALQYASNDNGFIGSAGECIIVRVPVTHASLTENLTNETINLIVNGEMVNPENGNYDGTYPDLDNATTAGDPCVDDYDDNADYIITPRPTITEVDPTPFEPKTP